MTIDEIKELIQVVNETGIAELLVQRGEHSVKIVRTLVPNQERVLPVSASTPGRYRWRLLRLPRKLV